MRLRSLYIFLCCGLLLSCQDKDDSPRKFTVTPNTGITFENRVKDSTHLNILNYLYFYNGAGTAIADFNNDGIKDIYFTSNQGPDHLYIGRGDLNFENQTATSGITNSQGWTTGVTTVDINADGFMDIYISKVAQHLDLKGHNLLYINQGIREGKVYFKEAAATYGLDFSGYGTQAAFFDYDLDGDLDVYLLNHSLFPNGNYGKGSIRKRIDAIAGDKLLRNDSLQFTDVTASAGILSSKIGYGLGLSIGDINKDNYPDIYVGNDFFENDYLYINQKDGTFKEQNVNSSLLGHTSHYTMGTDIADINNDGLSDILTLDMLPEDLITLKSAGAEFAYPIYQNQLRNGYRPQYMQNTLQLNKGNGRFSEIAFQAGIAATEWSWAPLVADFDNDQDKDIFISNGIQGATNDMDFVNFISNDHIQSKLGEGMTAQDLALINKLPEKKVANYFFENNGDATFTNTSNTWAKTTPSFSNGATYADLDNDGDLDIVVNNVNEPAIILENHSEKAQNPNHFIQISLQGKAHNTQGIGAQVTIYTPSATQFFENYTTRGYLSAVPPEIATGLGPHQRIDSILVRWPSQKQEVLRDIASDQRIVVKEGDAKIATGSERQNATTSLVIEVDPLIDFQHKDPTTIEFDREPLNPYASTNLGKTLVTADINGDGNDDILALGAKGQASSIYLYQNGAYQNMMLPDALQDAIAEDTDAALFDADGNGSLDIVIVSGGNEFKSGPALRPRLYLQTDTAFVKVEKAFGDLTLNASSVTAVDIDNDNNLDLSFTANVIPHRFAQSASQYVYKNSGQASFTDVTTTFAPEFKEVGNVQAVVWVDIDQNGFKDAILAGHWMPIQIYLNNGQRLVKQSSNGLSKSNGLWNTITAADIDLDGDLDLIAGNWGHNTKLNASPSKPLRVRLADFDDNGTVDPIVSYYQKETETTLATKDELVKQIPMINKKFLSYNAFAKASIDQLFSKQKLKNAQTKEVYTLSTTFFENNSNQFTAKALPFDSQTSSVNDILISDLNNDEYLDLFLVGNTYEISTQLGRLDGSHGVLLLNDKNGYFQAVNERELEGGGPGRSVQKLQLNQQMYYVIGRNNETPIFLKKTE